MAGHIAANRELVATQLDGVRALLAGGPRTAYDIGRALYAERWSADLGSWLLTQTLAWLIHLQALGEVARAPGDTADSWSLV
jgi:hypothetical protein